MNDPIEVRVESERAELVADELFGLGASAVSEQASEGSTVLLIADPDPVLLASSSLSWVPHTPLPSPGPEGPVSIDVGDVTLWIDAEGAFGSGSHPTTRLCLATVPELVRQGCSVLDVGSGSGALGVAAALHGADRVVAIDIDPPAVDATNRTAVLNGVDGRVRASTEPLHHVPGQFDVVFANLLIPIIEDLGEELVHHVGPGGRLVLSGVLGDQVDRAMAAVAPMQLERSVEVGGWEGLIMSHPLEGTAR